MNRLRFLILLLLLGLASYFAYNSSLTPDNLEARNFEAARLVVANGNWLTPGTAEEANIVNPPLPTWITALVIKIVKDPADLRFLRLPAAIMALLMALFAGSLMKTLTGNRSKGYLTVIALASSALIIQMSKVNSWDIYAHSFMLGGLFAFAFALKRDSITSFILAGICFGLSFMSNGPIAHYTMLLPFLIAYVWSFKTLHFTRNTTGLLWCGITFLIVGVWWPVYLLFQQDITASLIARTESDSWTSQYLKPFLVYLHFPFYAGIWAVFIVASFFPRYAKKRVGKNKHYKFALIWTLASIVLLMIIPEKKEGYMLAAMAPMALLTAHFLYYFLKKGKENLSRADLMVWSILSAVVIVVCLAIVSFQLYTHIDLELQLLSRISLSVALCFGVAILAVYFRWQRIFSGTIFTVLAVISLFCIFVFPVIPDIVSTKNYYSRINCPEENQPSKSRYYPSQTSQKKGFSERVRQKSAINSYRCGHLREPAAHWFYNKSHTLPDTDVSGKDLNFRSRYNI